MLSSDGKLDALVKRAMEIFNNLTPEEQAAHRREQAISWALGQVQMSRYEKGQADFSEEELTKLRLHVEQTYDQRKKESNE